MKKIKPARKKLKLKRESIKVLSTHHLKQLHGGDITHTDTNTDSRYPDCLANSNVTELQ